MSGELKTNNILWLREATLDDMILLFCWVNDPIVRQSAFCVNEISLTTHKRWFAEALMNDYVRIYILMLLGAVTGMGNRYCAYWRQRWKMVHVWWEK